jgi:Cu/Ag efflux protein CusF
MKKLLVMIAAAVALAALGGCNRSNSAAGKSVSGDVQAVDVPAMALTVVSPTGDVQHIVVAADAPVTRDGSASSLDQVKQGDNVRASFDQNSNKASRIDVRSKGDSGSNPPAK